MNLSLSQIVLYMAHFGVRIIYITNNKFIIVARRDSDYKSYLTWVSVGSGTITASGNTFDINNVTDDNPF